MKPPASIHLSVAALLCAAFGLAGAQSLPASMAVTASLSMPTGLTATPLSINSQGQVGGFGLKSAGSALRVGTRYNVPFNSSYLYWDPQSYIYPVLWTNGTPSQPARYKSTYNTSILGEAASGSWVALTTNSAAKVSTSSVMSTGQTYQAQLALTLTNGVYAPLLPDGVSFTRVPLVNRKGTLAGIGRATPSAGLELLVSNRGQTARVPMPSGLFNWEVVGLSDDDQVLLEGDREEIVTRVGDTLVYTQYRWQKRCFVWRAGSLTEVSAPAPAPVVSINCAGIGPDGQVAAFVSHAAGGELMPYGLTKALFTWRNGQVERFQTDFKVFASDYLPRVTLTSAGWGVYDSALDGRSDTLGDPRVFIHGQHVRLASLVLPAIGATDRVWVKSVNAAGQMLVQIVPASVSTAPRHVVLTPR